MKKVIVYVLMLFAFIGAQEVNDTLACLTEEACSDGFYGLFCDRTCGQCAGNRPCNKITGQCETCAPGFDHSADSTCTQKCRSGYYGQNCERTCSLNCSPAGICDYRTGQCSCQLGFKPGTCSEPDDRATLSIIHAAFLPGVSQSIQMTCRPPVGEDIAKLLKLEVYKEHGSESTGSLVPVVSYVIGSPPVVESLGSILGASSSGSYDMANPELSYLEVSLPKPTDTAEGTYTCSVETLDSHELLNMYAGKATLTSLRRNGSVPAFYHSLLQELRIDMDSLSSDFATLQSVQRSVAVLDSKVQAELSNISNIENSLTGDITDVNNRLSDVNYVERRLSSRLDDLCLLTPDSPINFYAYLSSTYVDVSNGANIIFDAPQQHTDDASYSTSTGFFTAPANGTYYFRTSITGIANAHNYASITVNGQDGTSTVSSLHGFDDYGLSQSTASAVVSLTVGDQVSVVKKITSRIYGTEHINHITYFMGMLLW